MLKAGYLEDWRWHATLSGSPQGGIASPVLSNIYLDRLDQYVEQRLLPEYNLGRRRRPNPAYQVAGVRDRNGPARHGDRAEARGLILQRRQLPSQDPNDPGYRRLRYVRYCRRLAAGVRRSQARGRGDQVEDRGVPARGTQAGTVAVQDADHARHQPGGALPRLRDPRPALRHQDHPEPPGGQRSDRAVRAQDRHPAAVRALHEQGETGATRRAASRRRFHHRREVPGRVRRVSSSTTSWPRMSSAWAASTGSWRPRCSRRWPASTARTVSKMARKYKADHRDTRRAAQVPAGHRRARQGQEATGHPLRRDTRSGERARPSSPTSGRSWPAPSATS